MNAYIDKLITSLEEEFPELQVELYDDTAVLFRYCKKLVFVRLFDQLPENQPESPENRFYTLQHCYERTRARFEKIAKQTGGDNHVAQRE